MSVPTVEELQREHVARQTDEQLRAIVAKRERLQQIEQQRQGIADLEAEIAALDAQIGPLAAEHGDNKQEIARLTARNEQIHGALYATMPGLGLALQRAAHFRTIADIRRTIKSMESEL